VAFLKGELDEWYRRAIKAYQLKLRKENRQRADYLTRLIKAIRARDKEATQKKKD